MLLLVDTVTLERKLLAATSARASVQDASSVGPRPTRCGVSSTFHCDERNDTVSQVNVSGGAFAVARETWAAVTRNQRTGGGTSCGGRPRRD